MKRQFYDLKMEGESSSNTSVEDLSTSCLCGGVVSCSGWDRWVRTGQWVSTTEFRGKQQHQSSMQRKDRRREGGERGNTQTEQRVEPRHHRDSPKWCVLYSLYLTLLSSVNHHLFFLFFFTALLNYDSLFGILSYLAKWRFFLQKSICLHEIHYTDAMKCCEYTVTAEKIKTGDGWSYIDRDQIS